MDISTAVGLERISRVVGYQINKGDFAETSPNLPQCIAVLAEANTAQQAGLINTPQQITSSQQAGVLFGFGSPAHRISDILFPSSGGGIGGIPVYVYAQNAAVSSVAKVLTITPTGTATGNGVHRLIIAGRGSVGNVPYDVNIVTGDTPATIVVKISDAINNVLGSPVIATQASGVATATAKWTGLSSDAITITVDNGGSSLGVTYAVASTATGAGTPSIAAALQMFGSQWNTIVVNSYGTVSTALDALESYNGIPLDTPTGRYTGIIMKPFIAITGSNADNPTSITDSRSSNVTIAIAPAPLSVGFPMEAAANMTVVFARTAQDTPHLDVSGKSYPDEPAPVSIGTMADYNNRDSYVKKGSSTVDLVASLYQIQDFVTTYHPLGETPAQFRYCRNLMLDFNVRYGYYLLEQQYVVDHVIANDKDVVGASKVIKPKQWIQILKSYADDLANRGLIADPDFMKNSISVSISTSNPDRLNTFFRYKRTGCVRISSTTAEAGFNFGT